MHKKYNGGLNRKNLNQGNIYKIGLYNLKKLIIENNSDFNKNNKYL